MVILFNYQGAFRSVSATAYLLYHSRFRLSRTFFHFLNFFFVASLNEKAYLLYFIFLEMSTTFFTFFDKKTNGHYMEERRKRDLNPRAAVSDLHP